MFPSGRTDILLKVPRFDWHWQNWYNLEQPIALPKGHQDRLHRPLRQLGEQPGGRRSHQRSDVGRPELGRDDDRVFQPGVRRRSPGGQTVRQEAQGRDRGRSRRIIALAEPGETIHQPFADAAMRWLQETAATEGFTVDYIRTTDPIDEAYLAAHDLFVQVNYPPYRWTPVAEAAFKKAMEQGTIGWVGFHHASLLGKFDRFEMSPFFHQFMGNIVFKSYIRDFATGTLHVEDPAHPVVKGLPAAFTIENDEWVHLRPIAPARCTRARKRR